MSVQPCPVRIWVHLNAQHLSELKAQIEALLVSAQDHPDEDGVRSSILVGRRRSTRPTRGDTPSPELATAVTERTQGNSPTEGQGVEPCDHERELGPRRWRRFLPHPWHRLPHQVYSPSASTTPATKGRQLASACSFRRGPTHQWPRLRRQVTKRRSSGRLPPGVPHSCLMRADSDFGTHRLWIADLPSR